MTRACRRERVAGEIIQCTIAGRRCKQPRRPFRRFRVPASMHKTPRRRHAPLTQHKETSTMKPKNMICLWFDKDALAAARFYAATFPDSKVTAVHKAPADFPGGK